jgi:gliding motility-associated-like protein
VSGGASADYTFNYVPGTLTIVPLINADLISLTTSSGILSPQFDAGTFTYNVTVDNVIADLKLTATFDITASATVNDMATPNGSPSSGVPLSVGNNLLTLTVTAQDGVTKKTYSINVYRGIAPTSITSNNILTPNGDGKNDFWVVKDIQLYPNNRVTVYDSGGRSVFSKRGYNNDWGGTLNETGVPLAGGTYFYTVDLGIGQNVIKGYISIIRSN